MSSTMCVTRDCNTAAVWQLVTTECVVYVCSRHLDGWTTRLNSDGHAPVQRPVNRQEPPVTTLTGPAPELSRDRYGRPLVVPPDGGKPVPYMRATTLAGTIEDTFNLARWQQRMVAVGLADRPDLLLAVAAHREDRDRLNDLCEKALEAARGHAGATIGTALHALCEQIDRCLDVSVPDQYRPDLDAYVAATTGLGMERIEEFTVIDDLQVGGTPDRVVRLPDGRLVIADLKTGSIEWGIGKIALQLALYAHAEAYDIVTGKRSPLEVDQDTALVIHLPAGQGMCELVEVDIGAGWDAVGLALQVRGWRKRRDLARSVSGAAAARPLAEQITLATTVADLESLWAARHAEFTELDIEKARTRRAELEGVAS